MKDDGDEAQGKAASGRQAKSTDRAAELRATLERGAYDGIHGIPKGLSAQSSRTYRNARDEIFFESAEDAGGRARRQHREKPVTINDALSWLEAHRAGHFDQVPQAVRAQVALLASFLKRHERNLNAAAVKAKTARKPVRKPAAPKRG
jgi:hypothetical protein